MILTSSRGPTRAGLATADTTDPSSVSAVGVLPPGTYDYVQLSAVLSGTTPTATVVLRVYDAALNKWFDVDGSTITFTGEGSKRVRANNPGGAVWAKVSNLSAGATISLSLLTQRQEHGK